MPQATPLVDLLDALRVDAGEQHAYSQDPEGYLASHGWADLDPSEFVEALGFARESMSLDVAVTIPDAHTNDDAEDSLTDAVDGYLGAVAPVDVDDTDDVDLEDFGADATPYVPDPFDDDLDTPSIGDDVDDPLVIDDNDDDGPDVDLGPADDDDDDDDDDPDHDDLIDI